MTPAEMRERATEVFNRDKMLCSQSIVTAGLEFIGCLIGALAVIGDLFGRSDPEETEDARIGPTARIMYRRFREMIEEMRGTMMCSGASKTNWLGPKDVQAFKVDGRRKQCGEIVGRTAELLGEVIIETIGESELALLQAGES